MTELNGPRLLVVGAAPQSLGAAVADVARDGVWTFGSVVTAGMTPIPESLLLPEHEGTVHTYEDYRLDVRFSNQMKQVLGDVQPDILVCTVGVNAPCGIGSRYLAMRMEEAFRVNVIGVLELLRHFALIDGSGYWKNGRTNAKKFVAISSNSARLPRRQSLAYCASKAALSMGLRVAARELAGTMTQVWGYEPGLLAGTPMTQETEQHFGRSGESAVLHRMRGVPADGLPVRSLAQQIVNDVAQYAPGLNGVLVPCDAGEQ